MYYYKPSVKTGDIFLTHDNNEWLAKGIRFIQKIYAEDNEALYSHAGIILDSAGNTFESKMRVGSYCFFEQYANMNVVIYRPPNKKSLKTAIQKIIQKHDGDIYPIYRLFFHLLGVADHIHWNRQLVCSELVAKYLYYAELRDGHYYGTTPDNLHDEFRNNHYFKLIYEGKLPYIDSIGR